METVNLIFNWALAIGLVGFLAYCSAWVAVTYDRGRYVPPPCGRKHRDEL